MYKKSIEEALSVMYNDDSIIKEIMKNHIEVLPFDSLPGRTLHKSYIILEEGQNFEWNETLVLLTRIPEGSVCVVNGDPNQVTRYKLNEIDNGLTQLNLKNGGKEDVSTVYVTKNERGGVSKIVDQQTARRSFMKR